ncbi:hypothetical protein LCGC14_2226620 [marine sediment metagenome]|uniref:Uncharacterized protein n=1 Tax=marine sediment metagenome TaxID=412755 RepID=A0A0F9D9G1_9ZZZZ
MALSFGNLIPTSSAKMPFSLGYPVGDTRNNPAVYDTTNRYCRVVIHLFHYSSPINAANVGSITASGCSKNSHLPG